MSKWLLMLVAVLTVTVGSMAAARADTPLTQDQVNSVCGKDIKSGYGHTGCDKVCGNGKHVCDYDCYKGKCSGFVVGLEAWPSGPQPPRGQVFAMPAGAVIRSCDIDPKTGQGHFGCSVPCDLQICTYNCTSTDICTVTISPKQAKLDPEPQNLAPAGGGGVVRRRER
ncbi:MAG: hypothetical protein P4M09_30320 [Devosia sp.]|nr:hypothetical protein [Devosia sp.]